MHTIYNTTTGEITGSLSCPEHLYDMQVPLLEPESSMLRDGGYPDKNTHYVSGNTILSRQTITATINKTTLSANAIDSIEISNLPIPCTITVNSNTYEVTDGVFEFTVDTPGTYTIKAECFPYQPKSWEVIAE
jgi:hypothetical protein